MTKLIAEENVISSSPLTLSEEEREKLEVFLRCLSMGAGRLDGSELSPRSGVIDLDALRERILADCPVHGRN